MSCRAHQLAGKRFTRLVVIARAGSNKDRQAIWQCVCDCGTTRIISAGNLVSGTTKSCGCLQRELAAKRSTLDLVAKRFTRLLVIARVGTDKYGSALWKCVCDCGSECVINAGSLMSRNTKSCGCLPHDRWRKHGHNTKEGPSATYRSWVSMTSRCTNPKHNSWEDYGGRGIRVCERWRGEHGFENFLADLGERPEGHTLDRIDVNGNYEPSNCRWATYSEQRRNQRIADPFMVGEAAEPF